jgi:hypothetical protein
MDSKRVLTQITAGHHELSAVQVGKIMAEAIAGPLRIATTCIKIAYQTLPSGAVVAQVEYEADATIAAIIKRRLLRLQPWHALNPFDIHESESTNGNGLA